MMIVIADAVYVLSQLSASLASTATTTLVYSLRLPPLSPSIFSAGYLGDIWEPCYSSDRPRLRARFILSRIEHGTFRTRSLPGQHLQITHG